MLIEPNYSSRDNFICRGLSYTILGPCGVNTFSTPSYYPAFSLMPGTMTMDIIFTRIYGRQ